MAFEGQKHSDFVFKLLQLLAFQIGNEVSYTGLAQILQVGKNLVEKYINILEKCFVIFRLNPLSRNLRNEIGKKRKIYFWDTGLRNALIQNFADIKIRPDIGNLWENFCIAQRVKSIRSKNLVYNTYYWRTYEQKELDYIEEFNGVMYVYEIKWEKENSKNSLISRKVIHKMNLNLLIAIISGSLVNEPAPRFRRGPRFRGDDMHGYDVQTICTDRHPRESGDHI